MNFCPHAESGSRLVVVGVSRFRDSTTPGLTDLLALKPEIDESADSICFRLRGVRKTYLRAGDQMRVEALKPVSLDIPWGIDSGSSGILVRGRARCSTYSGYSTPPIHGPGRMRRVAYYDGSRSFCYYMGGPDMTADELRRRHSVSSSRPDTSSATSPRSRTSPSR